MSEIIITPTEKTASTTADFREIQAHLTELKGDSPNLDGQLKLLAGDRVFNLDPALTSLIEFALRHLADGRSVKVGSLSEYLTTSQAAELIGVTRPTLIKLATEAGLEFHMAGTHRRLTVHEALAISDYYREKQSKGLEELMRLDKEAGLYDIDIHELVPIQE